MSQIMINLENTFNCIHFIRALSHSSACLPNIPAHTTVNICSGEIVIFFLFHTLEGRINSMTNMTQSTQMYMRYFICLAQGFYWLLLLLVLLACYHCPTFHFHNMCCVQFLKCGDLVLTALIFAICNPICKENYRRMSFSLISWIVVIALCECVWTACNRHQNQPERELLTTMTWFLVLCISSAQSEYLRYWS